MELSPEITKMNCLDSCEKVMYHVGRCKECQRHLSFSPAEKLMLKSYSFKNEALEFLAYLSTGAIIIGMMFAVGRVSSNNNK